MVEFMKTVSGGDHGNNDDPPAAPSLSGGDHGNNDDPPAAPTIGRRLRDINVSYISLVPAAANRRSVIMKGVGVGGAERVVRVVKGDTLKKMVFGIVYAPNERDAQGDMATKEDIEAAAYGFMRRGATSSVDAFHDEVIRDAFVAESWIVRKGDPIFNNESEGAWAVGIKISDDSLWKQVEEGVLNGLSMMGTAKGESVSKEGFGSNFRSKLFDQISWTVFSAFSESIGTILREAKGAEVEDKLQALFAEFLSFLRLQGVVPVKVEKSGEFDRIDELLRRVERIELLSKGRQTINISGLDDAAGGLKLL